MCDSFKFWKKRGGGGRDWTFKLKRGVLMVVEIGCGDGWIVGVEINLLNGFPDFV